jgi:hypothetical protein
VRQRRDKPLMRRHHVPLVVRQTPQLHRLHPITKSLVRSPLSTAKLAFFPRELAIGLPDNRPQSTPSGIEGGIYKTGTGSHGTAARERTRLMPLTTPSRCPGSPTPGTRRSHPSRCSSPRPSGPTHRNNGS